jgi:DNA-binding transcriptional LysR family regulator
MRFTLHELACLDAVVSEGSFQAAAGHLKRSHPAVFAAVRKLERGVGVALLDRSGYRVVLTETGHAFHRRAAELLGHARALDDLANQLEQGVETDLRIVIGDLTPTTPVLRLLKRFFADWPQTRLHLHFEALGGPWERMVDGEADLIVHHIDPADTRFEHSELLQVTLVPVAAPGFLPFRPTRTLTPEQMKPLVQVIIRDSATHSTHDYFLIEGAPSRTVADQQTKKELILEGMGWGHMPLHLVEHELLHGQLISLEGRHFRRRHVDIVAARLRGRAVGPAAIALWNALAGAAI